MLLHFPDILDLEARDGEGKTALWHAVRGELYNAAVTLIKGGARVFYENEDMSCPLQLATQTMLLKNKVKITVLSKSWIFNAKWRNGFRAESL